MTETNRVLRWFKGGFIAGLAAHLILWLPYFQDVHMSPWPDILEASFYPHLCPGLTQAVHRLSSAVSAAVIPLGHKGFIFSAGFVYPGLFIYLSAMEAGVVFAAAGFLLRRGGLLPMKRAQSLAVAACVLVLCLGGIHWTLAGRKPFALAAAGAVLLSATLALLLGGDPALSRAAGTAQEARRRFYGFFGLAA